MLCVSLSFCCAEFSVQLVFKTVTFRWAVFRRCDGRRKNGSTATLLCFSRDQCYKTILLVFSFAKSIKSKSH